MKLFLPFAAVVLLAAPPSRLSESPDVRAALDRISPDSLRGNVSFLASDLLEGRDTPSRGLEVAAEYIAAQFRRAGLKPAGDDGYFQTAGWVKVEPDMKGFEMSVEIGGKTYSVQPDQVRPNTTGAFDLAAAPLVRLNPEEVKPGEFQGKVIAIPLGRSGPGGFGAMREALLAAKPRLVILVTGDGRRMGPAGGLRDPGEAAAPTVMVRSAELLEALSGAGGGRVTLRLAAPAETPVKLRNVIGMIPGAGPVLKDTYVLLGAHYDHVGTRPGAADPVFNGANDDASGVASVIELAQALNGMKERPKRSIVFLAFFGEEKGLLGSRYYARRPVFPIARTVAEVNLEHMGRTDSTEGSQEGTLTFTGFDFSTVPSIFAQAGEETGVKVWKSEANSDSFFARSDNQALADMGVPAHTACVSFLFPDYHQAGDEWQKLDYDNMARVNRTLALGLLSLANSEEAPKWNESPKTKKYIEAWRKLQPAVAGGAR